MNINRTYLFLLVMISFSFFTKAGNNNIIRFSENKGQWNNNVLFRAQLDGGALFLEKNKLTYHFYDKDTYRSFHANPKAIIKDVKSSYFVVNFLNSSINCKVDSKESYPDYENYFLGKSRTNWASNVKSFKEINYSNLFEGVNMQVIGSESSVKYNFYVTPGAESDNIKMLYKGADNLFIKDGSLFVSTEVTEVVEEKPYAFQVVNGKKMEVSCKFKLDGNVVSFEFPNGYNENYELVIDPILVFACSSGSTADNFGMTATYDKDGNLYSGGAAFNIGYPTFNAYDSTYNSIVQYGQTDVVITKYDSSGTYLHYSTYLGGAIDAEVVHSLIVDSLNNLYIYGVTSSSDFPITSNAAVGSFLGGQRLRFFYNGYFFEHGTDIFVSKISNSGDSLIASTFMGGTMNDGVNYTIDSVFMGTFAPYGDVYQPIYDSLFFNYGDQNRGDITIDNNGNIVIVSATRSNDFPIVNGFDTSISGVQDAILFSLSNDLSTLNWSTFVGGTGMEAGNSLVISRNNNVYLTGGTTSNDFPITSGGYDSIFNGGKGDAFITCINNNGSGLRYSTFLGTTMYDQSFFVRLDNQNNVYVFGQTMGGMGVVNATYFVNNGRQFVSKLDSTLGTLLMQTRFGNGSSQVNISPSAFMVDCNDNIYISGWGGNIVTGIATNNMPITSNALQATTDGFNFYLMVLSSNSSALLYATYFGGNQSHEHVDGGTSRFDPSGTLYQSVCAGCGGNDDFPVTPGSWPTAIYGTNWNQSTNCNNGVFKIKPDSICFGNSTIGIIDLRRDNFIFTVYPIPFYDFVNIEFENEKKTVLVKVYNNLGMLVKNELFSKVNRIKFDLSTLNNGIYSMIVEMDGVSEVKRIVKQ